MAFYVASVAQGELKTTTVDKNSFFVEQTLETFPIFWEFEFWEFDEYDDDFPGLVYQVETHESVIRAKESNRITQVHTEYYGYEDGYIALKDTYEATYKKKASQRKLEKAAKASRQGKQPFVFCCTKNTLIL